MMSMEKLTTGMSYAALGAFAAYFGFWWSGTGSQTRLLPMVFALGMAANGLAMVTRNRKLRVGRPVPGNAPPLAYRGEAAQRADEGLSEDRAKGASRQADAALLGHEMKNYLCTLKGNARLLRQCIRAKDANIIDRIDRVVEKLESLAMDMATAPGPNATANRQLRPVRLDAAAKACITTHFHKDAARFAWEILDGGITMGDPDRLEQVFLNLYSNALEAGASRVLTTMRRVENRIRICIEDDGKGCPAEDLARIFEPFFSTKAGPARRGLGMFIVQSILENHGGRILVQSKNGIKPHIHGLIFTLEFPFHESSRAEMPQTPFSPRPRSMPPTAGCWPCPNRSDLRPDGGPRSDGNYPIPSSAAAAISGAKCLYFPGYSF